jgi:hypothetical protein
MLYQEGRHRASPTAPARQCGVARHVRENALHPHSQPEASIACYNPTCWLAARLIPTYDLCHSGLRLRVDGRSTAGIGVIGEPSWSAPCRGKYSLSMAILASAVRIS